MSAPPLLNLHRKFRKVCILQEFEQLLTLLNLTLTASPPQDYHLWPASQPAL
jgi:hypothetical protein